MSLEHLDGPALAPTHRGFSGPHAPEAQRRAPVDARRMIVIGVGVALALGLVFGLWAKPPAIGASPKPAPMRAVSVPGDGQVQIVVNPDKPPPVVKAAPGRLEVLPSDMAQAAPRVAAAPPAAFAPLPPERFEADVVTPAEDERPAYRRPWREDAAESRRPPPWVDERGVDDRADRRRFDEDEDARPFAPAEDEE